jgi:hypothetical protein
VGLTKGSTSVVVGEGLGQALVGVGAGQHVAEHVVGIREVLDDVASAGQDRVEPPGGDIEALGGDDAVAGGLLDQVQFGVAGVRGPVGQAAGGPPVGLVGVRSRK